MLLSRAGGLVCRPTCVERGRLVDILA